MIGINHVATDSGYVWGLNDSISFVRSLAFGHEILFSHKYMILLRALRVEG